MKRLADVAAQGAAPAPAPAPGAPAAGGANDQPVPIEMLGRFAFLVASRCLRFFLAAVVRTVT